MNQQQHQSSSIYSRGGGPIRARVLRGRKPSGAELDGHDSRNCNRRWRRADRQRADHRQEHRERGDDANAQSNDAGNYSLVGLVPGTYDVNVRRIGNAPADAHRRGADRDDTRSGFCAGDPGGTARNAGRDCELRASKRERPKSRRTSTQAADQEAADAQPQLPRSCALAPGVTVTEDRVNGTVQDGSAGGQAPSLGQSLYRRHELQE